MVFHAFGLSNAILTTRYFEGWRVCKTVEPLCTQRTKKLNNSSARLTNEKGKSKVADSWRNCYHRIMIFCFVFCDKIVSWARDTYISWYKVILEALPTCWMHLQFHMILMKIISPSVVDSSSFLPLLTQCYVFDQALNTINWWFW